jgi:predicted RNA-binding Zn-ribbon protein involved in translation (DUF1610 family)
MVLIKCPECTKDVSNNADKCIHCGYPLAERNKPKDSVGKCPKCGSYNTYDAVEADRKKSGLAGAIGSRLGLRFSGQGRMALTISEVIVG